MSQVFAYTFNKHILRVVCSDNKEVLFCLSDICHIVNLTNPSSVAAMIKEEFELNSLLNWKFPTNTGAQQFNVITFEQFIFTTMRIKAKDAKLFRHWVLMELLPKLIKQHLMTNKEAINSKYEKKLEFLKLCLNTDNITKEQHTKMLKKLCEEYINAD